MVDSAFSGQISHPPKGPVAPGLRSIRARLNQDKALAFFAQAPPELDAIDRGGVASPETPAFSVSDPLLKAQLLVGEMETQPLNPKNLMNKNVKAGNHPEMVVSYTQRNTRNTAEPTPNQTSTPQSPAFSLEGSGVVALSLSNLRTQWVLQAGQGILVAVGRANKYLSAIKGLDFPKTSISKNVKCVPTTTMGIPSKASSWVSEFDSLEGTRTC